MANKIPLTTSQYIQNPPSTDRQSGIGNNEINKPFSGNNNLADEKPVGFNNPLYNSNVDTNRPSERITQNPNTNRASILPPKEINLNKDLPPFRLNPGFTISAENRNTAFSQNIDSMLPMSKQTEANLQRIADQVNRESQFLTTKKLDNYQFGQGPSQEIELDSKESNTSEFYSNLALKAKNMNDFLQNLFDITQFCDENYKAFQKSRTSLKNEINQYQANIISKQEIEDLATLFTELKAIEGLAGAVEKYSNLAKEALEKYEQFKSQGIEVSSKEYLDLNTEFVNIHSDVAKEQQILQYNLERFLEVWKSKPNTPECEEKAHILFKGIQEHKKVYQVGWEKNAKLITLLGNEFNNFALDVFRNTNTYKQQIAKLKSCKNEIEQADNYNKKLISIKAKLDDYVNILKRLFSIGKTSYPSLDKQPDYQEQLRFIDENLKICKNDLTKIRYHIKNFGDPCSVETQYFQVFRYKLRDQLELTLIECERKIDLIKGLGEALHSMEKGENALIEMYGTDDGLQRQLDNRVKDLSTKAESRNIDKKALEEEIKKLCKQFNTVIAEYSTHHRRIKSFLENSEISEALGSLITVFSQKLNDLIRSCISQNEKVYKMRFMASEIESEFSKIDTTGSLEQYKKFFKTILTNNSYQNATEIINNQSFLQKTLSDLRKNCTSIENLLLKSNRAETRKKMQADIVTFKVCDENLQLLDDVLNCAGKIKLTIENFIEKTTSKEIVRNIELNIKNLKDERDFIEQVAAKLKRFYDEKTGKDYEDSILVCKWYFSQLSAIAKIYQLIIEFFTKKLPNIRALPEPTKELETAFKEFTINTDKELDAVKDKFIRSKYELLVKNWGDLLKSRIQEESSQTQYRNDYLLYLQEKLERLELFNFTEHEEIRDKLLVIRRTHKVSTPSTIENILTDSCNIKYTSLIDITLNLAYDYKSENDISTYLNKTLPALIKSIAEKVEKNDFDNEFGDNNIKYELITWGQDLTKALTSLMKLLEGLSLGLIEFHTKKIYGRYQNVKEFLSEFMKNYEEILRKFSNQNQNYKNLSKFAPTIDMAAFYLKYYTFETGFYKDINEFSQTYIKYVDAVKKSGADYRSYLNKSSDLLNAKANYDKSYTKVRNTFDSFINMSEKIEEIFDREDTLNKIIEDTIEIIQRGTEDINLKRFSENNKKIQKYTQDIYHGDLEDALALALPEVYKYFNDKLNNPDKNNGKDLGQSQSNVQVSTVNNNQIQKKPSDINPQGGQKNGNISNSMPKKPGNDQDDDDDDVN